MLDLDGVGPPDAPPVRREVISVKLAPHLAVWVRERASAERTTMNGYIVALLRRERDGEARLPADCRAWLDRQAVQCDLKGDPDAALVAVIRHLADRWPDGARLR